ncbi:hypothetical protein EJB05_30346 [Eragrostis curvula]|uniref:Uncharacterized protein n=1 Tax=Eragrostis curvula TaxID=38414 RepID=A0A5J9UC15_9POAL|nr:hypothetical protein EJB05_30346 [Eragrostis curvula]
MATATSHLPPIVSTSASTVSLLAPLGPALPRLRFQPPPTSAAASPFSPGCGPRPLPSVRCRAAAGPSPPSSEPPPPSPQGKGSLAPQLTKSKIEVQSHSWQESLAKLQDRVRIFFAVLFWMSLFFWGSAWDGPNNSGGKKRQRFRKKQK